jgi:beta-glucanase (GH16 family)
MRPFLPVVGCLVLALIRITARADELLHDAFNAPALNTDNWSVGTWNLGRTELGNKPTLVAKTDTSPAYARLELDTFNPANDPSKNPREYLLRGTEMFSNKSFSVIPAGVRFEAKVRHEGILPPGLITSFFTYMSYQTPAATFADEIDFEFLSNQLNGAHGPILCSTWHDFMKDSTDYSNTKTYNSEYVTRAQTAAKADLTKWTVYAIDWYPDHVEWRMDGQLVRTAKQAVPTKPMTIRLNFWAPRADWSDAFNAGIQPTADPALGKKYFYDVSYVDVSTIR